MALDELDELETVGTSAVWLAVESLVAADCGEVESLAAADGVLSEADEGGIVVAGGSVTCLAVWFGSGSKFGADNGAGIGAPGGVAALLSAPLRPRGLSFGVADSASR